MDPERLAGRYPVLYHMAEDGSWESIRRIGLLSTSALLDRFEVEGERRYAIESTRRPEIVTLEPPERGTALVRDNKPMQEKALERCLHRMTSCEWYEHLNRRVFFWVERKRLLRLLGARAYRDRAHLVLEVDAAAMLRRHAQRVTLSPINSGATFALAPPRVALTPSAASPTIQMIGPSSSLPWTTPSPTNELHHLCKSLAGGTDAGGGVAPPGGVDHCVDGVRLRCLASSGYRELKGV